MKVVIDIPDNYYNWIKDSDKECTNYKITICLYDAVSNGTPLTKEEWIPVSDPLNELPTDRRLLVTVLEDYGSRYVTDLYWDMTEWSDIYYARKVIAYMSYPEPYEADKE